MRDLLTQVRLAADANLSLLSLFVALALPDICGALEAPDGRATRDRYATWFDKWVAPAYFNHGTPIFNGKDAYCFRCAVLHQGTSQHDDSRYTRIFFVDHPRVFMHKNIMSGSLNIDCRAFCRDVANGVEQWLAEVEGTQPFDRNYDRFLKRYPNGLEGSVKGVPVIA